MITENEIRIGNLLQDEDGTPLYVAGIWNLREEKYQYLDSGRNTYTKGQLYPITLTPEILEKCGFVRRSPTSEKCNIWDHKTLTTLAYFKETEDWTLLACPCARTFKYVHQLQNIWFALKDEELQVTL